MEGREAGFSWTGVSLRFGRGRRDHVIAGQALGLGFGTEQGALEFLRRLVALGRVNGHGFLDGGRQPFRDLGTALAERGSTGRCSIARARPSQG